jgi:dolichyl-phosphate-mannose--protein O-mannosyl transferase
LPAFFGALLPLVIYKLILAMGLSRRAAFLGGFLIIFDSAYLVQSKFILVDVFFIFFGFLSLLLFFLAKNYANSKNSQYLLYALSAVSAGLQ